MTCNCVSGKGTGRGRFVRRFDRGSGNASHAGVVEVVVVGAEDVCGFPG